MSKNTFALLSYIVYAIVIPNVFMYFFHDFVFFMLDLYGPLIFGLILMSNLFIYLNIIFIVDEYLENLIFKKDNN